MGSCIDFQSLRGKGWLVLMLSCAWEPCGRSGTQVYRSRHVLQAVAFHLYPTAFQIRLEILWSIEEKKIIFWACLCLYNFNHPFFFSLTWFWGPQFFKVIGKGGEREEQPRGVTHKGPYYFLINFSWLHSDTTVNTRVCKSEEWWGFYWIEVKCQCLCNAECIYWAINTLPSNMPYWHPKVGLNRMGKEMQKLLFSITFIQNSDQIETLFFKGWELHWSCKMYSLGWFLWLACQLLQLVLITASLPTPVFSFQLAPNYYWME